jgi:hypothetical protein
MNLARALKPCSSRKTEKLSRRCAGTVSYGRRDPGGRLPPRHRSAVFAAHWGEWRAVYTRNREPSLDELLDDPIARLVMASDRLQVEDVILHFDVVRRRLAASRPLGARRRQGWTRR